MLSEKVRYEVVEDNSIFKGIYIHRKSLDGVNSKYIWEIRIRVMIFVGLLLVNSQFVCVCV